jgi:hypothetical protein
MTHPFALSIDDLNTLELLETTETELQGGLKLINPDLYPTLAHEGIEGGIKPYPLPITKRRHECGGPIISTARYPEHGGPISDLKVESGIA